MRWIPRSSGALACLTQGKAHCFAEPRVPTIWGAPVDALWPRLIPPPRIQRAPVDLRGARGIGHFVAPVSSRAPRPPSGTPLSSDVVFALLMNTCDA
jgi:hypothetical protein